MVSEGHEVGIHTFDHTVLTTLWDDDVIKQIMVTESLIRRTTGFQPKYVRVPEG